MAVFAPVAVVDVVRTDIHKAFKSKYAARRPDDLVAECLDHLAERHPALIATGVDDCIVGCALPEGAQGLNLGRNCIAASTLPATIPGQTVNRYCGSGLQALINGAMCIASGNASLVFAGGTESVAMVMPHANTTFMRNPRISANLPTLYTYLFDEEKTRPFVKRAGLNMVGYAEVAAKMFSICRSAQDDYSYFVHERAQTALAKGIFREEMLPDRPGEVREDEVLARGTKRADFDRFSPVLPGEYSVTARNSAPLAEGASVGLLACAGLAHALDAKPLGYFLASAVTATNPEHMGLGAAQAIRKLLAKTKLALDDIDLFEINEPFAATGLATLAELGLSRSRVNPNGSALALGHPYGMTGTRIVGALLRHLNRMGGRFGIAATCIGGGMGLAALFGRTGEVDQLCRP
ncbi:MAG TPA: thiolase family protein [Xanthobacteraceae bacterium]|jgi:acetyl-CoA acyltransferase|nr:thiolase family protein [Xanthobacteraceae bacterium]